MSRSVNKVILLGHIGKDAESKFTQSGTHVCNFSIATERTWKNKTSGEWDKATDWHNIVLWKSEKLSEYLKKGTQVYVEGRLQTRSYEDREGTKRYVTEVIAESVVLCGGGKHGQSEGRSTGQTVQYDEPQGGIADDDVPF